MREREDKSSEILGRKKDNFNIVRKVCFGPKGLPLFVVNVLHPFPVEGKAHIHILDLFNHKHQAHLGGAGCCSQRRPPSSGAGRAGQTCA